MGSWLGSPPVAAILAIKLKLGGFPNLTATVNGLRAAHRTAIFKQHRMTFHPRREVVIDGRKKIYVLGAIAGHLSVGREIALMAISPQVFTRVWALVPEMLYAA